MKFLTVFTLAAMLLCAPGLGLAQEEETPTPANWGELAELLAANWGLELNLSPSGGNAAINALNLIGIGRESYDAIMEIVSDDTGPIQGDGYDPDNWLPDQELTGEFMCKLKMVVWAACFAGAIPYYEVPTAQDGQALTPEEEELARQIAEQAVTDTITIAKRDGDCAGSGQALCWICTGFVAPKCGWAPCP